MEGHLVGSSSDFTIMYSQADVEVRLQVLDALLVCYSKWGHLPHHYIYEDATRQYPQVVVVAGKVMSFCWNILVSAKDITMPPDSMMARCNKTFRATAQVLLDSLAKVMLKGVILLVTNFPMAT